MPPLLAQSALERGFRSVTAEAGAILALADPLAPFDIWRVWRLCFQDGGQKRTSTVVEQGFSLSQHERYTKKKNETVV